ncbi:alpha/beta hydrolase fold domain-containing protein [Staphylococcus cohnii]|uniref:alpha/beta hydrolase fold domain-containing protein n=1 Tax=Staphylococcus cohnii TaxID=29382 RepID=UPI00374F0FED
MKSRLITKFVNKYLLPHRSIIFDDQQSFEKFLQKRLTMNEKKHKQPETLNVKSDLEKQMMDDMQVFRFRFRHSQQKKILYIHGGYNILQPSAFHWRFMDKLALSTLNEVILPIYPKAPKYHVEDTYAAIHKVYQQLLTECSNEDIIVMGDGTGGALALSFVQQLKSNNQPLPAKLYLFSPMLDAKLDNENITDDLIDKDVIINIEGLQKIMKVWSGNLPLNDSRLSPINGELFGLPPIYIFGGGREIYLPDMKKLAYMLEDMRQPVQLYTFKKMVNAFALLPIRESHKVVKEIVNTIHDKR